MRIITKIVVGTALLATAGSVYAVDASINSGGTANQYQPQPSTPNNSSGNYNYNYMSPNSGTNSNNSLFQTFDSQVAVGVDLNAGSLYGNDYNNYGFALDATKLFNNGLWLNFGGNEAFANSLTSGSSGYLEGAIGYAVPMGDTVEFVPNFQLQRTQIAVPDFGQNATIKDAAVNFRFEWATSSSVNLFATAGFGLGQFNMTNNINGSSYNNTSALFQTEEGINYRPMANVPWLINLAYLYRSFNQDNLGPINGITLSTGLGF